MRINSPITTSAAPSRARKERRELRAAIERLRCFPEVPAALARLQARYRLVVLSNGDPDMLETAKQYHGIPFDRVISVAEAKASFAGVPEVLPVKVAMQVALAVMVTVAVEDVPEQGVRTHFIPLGQGGGSQASQIELLEVLDPAGTVARFLESRGPGVHHLSFEVTRGQLDGLCAKLREAGIRLIYDAPKPGAHGMRVNFIHPRSAGGVLLEVMEKGAG
mgnify:CR=1 FL=1